MVSTILLYYPDSFFLHFRSTVDSVVGSNLPQFNQTNLAIKGILGIAAMAKISGAAGKGDDVTRYEVWIKLSFRLCDSCTDGCFVLLLFLR